MGVRFPTHVYREIIARITAGPSVSVITSSWSNGYSFQIEYF